VNKLQKRVTILFLLIISLGLSSCSLLFYNKSNVNAEKKLFRQPLSRKFSAFISSRVELKAKKKRDAQKRKQNKEYAKATLASQKRTYDIQSSDVQARMARNKAKTDLRDKEIIKKRKAISKR
jgi:hypothetical protein